MLEIVTNQFHGTGIIGKDIGSHSGMPGDPAKLFNKAKNEIERRNNDLLQRRVNVSIRLITPRHLQRFLDGTIEGVRKRAIDRIKKAEPELAGAQENGGPALHISIHFDKKGEATCYIVDETEVLSGGANVRRYGFKSTKYLRQFLRMLRETGVKIEFHMPLHEMTPEGAVMLNPCELKDQEMLVLRYLFINNLFAKAGISSDNLNITEHMGYTRRGDHETVGGEKKFVIRTPCEVREDGVLNQLTYNMLLGRVDASYRRQKGRPDYRHGFETMPMDTVLSRHVSSPFDLITIVSAYGSLVPDVAHVMQNAPVNEFVFSQKDFKDYISSLRKQLRERRSDIEQHLKKMCGVLRENGFPISLTVNEIDAHLKKLENLGANARNGSGAEAGLPELIYRVKAAKKLLGRPQRSLITVAHIVSTDVPNIGAIEAPEKVLEAFRSDIPYVPGRNAQADAIVKAILDENPDALLVNEAGFTNINEGVRETLELGMRLNVHSI